MHANTRTSSDPPAGPARRILGRRRGLPTNRAVVGGLLVAVALIGTWWAAAGANRAPSTRYVVAGRDIGPGERLRTGDLRLVAVKLPPSLEAHALTRLDGLDDVVTTGPVGAGELVQASMLTRARGDGDARELSLVVQADWAVGGTLRAGNRIDVLVTFGDGAAATTEVVLSGATVRRISSVGDGGIGGTRTQNVTVAIANPSEAQKVTNAARAGDITITRATGVDRPKAGG